MITSPMKLATTSHAAFFELNKFGLIFITSQKNPKEDVDLEHGKPPSVHDTGFS